MKKRLAAAGDLVYLSERKLLNLATEFGVRTGSIDRDVALEGQAGAQRWHPATGECVSAGFGPHQVRRSG